MAATTNTTILDFDISVDPRKGVKEVQNFERNFADKMRRVRKSIRTADDGFDKFRKHMQAADVKKATTRGLAGKIESLDQQRTTFSNLRKNARLEALQAPAGSDLRKQKRARADELKEHITQIDVERAAYTRSQAEIVEDEEFDPAELKEAGARAGKEMLEPLEDFFSKDAMTLFKRFNKILFWAPMKALGATKIPERWAAHFAKKSRALVEKGEGRVEKGKALVESGKTLKGLATQAGGGLTKALGSITSMIGNLGPMLSMVGAIGMGIMKLLLDAEAGAKKFNKQLLQTSSTSGYLVRSFGDAAKATADLDNTLSAARDGANDLSLQFKWGVSADVAGQYLSSISNAGVALEKMGQAHGRGAVSADRYTANIKMGVAFSRQFGVSLSELADLQGQLMADLGMNAEQTQASFQTIVEGAAEAGMESQKFFGIVRSFSSDLSLFSLRLGDVTKLLGVLGKTMDPRKMQQFLGELNQTLGSFDEGIKVTFIAGDKGRKIVEQDAADKMQALTDAIRAQLGPGAATEKAITDLKAAMEIKNADERDKAIGAWNAAHGMAGELAETVIDVANVTKRLASGDMIDTASIVSALSPMKKYQMLDASVREVFKKGIHELSGQELKGFSEMTGLQIDFITSIQKLRIGVIQSQQDMMARLTARDEKGQLVGIQPKDLQQLGKMGIETKGKTREELVDAVKEWTEKQGLEGEGLDAWFKTMDKTDQDLINNSTKVRNFQEEAASLQVSMLDRVEMIADYLLSKIYKVLIWIWKILVNFASTFMGNEKAVVESARAAASGSTDQGLSEIFDRNENLFRTKAAVVSEVAPRAQEAVKRAIEKYKELEARVATGKEDPEVQRELKNQMQKLAPALKYAKQANMETGDYQFSLHKAMAEDERTLADVVEEQSAMLELGRQVDKKKPEVPEEAAPTDKPVTTAQATAIGDAADAVASLPEALSGGTPEANMPLTFTPEALNMTPVVPPAAVLAAEAEPKEVNVSTEVRLILDKHAGRYFKVASQNTVAEQPAAGRNK